MKKLLGPILSLILLGGIGLAIYFSASEQFHLQNTQTADGLIGSEKKPLFRDEAFQKRFARLGIDIKSAKAGSREIARLVTENAYDYGFPAGLPAAEKIRRSVSGTKSYSPFFTPMVVASWKPIAKLLEANGLATQRNGHYFLDMKKYVAAVTKGTRWSDLQNNRAFPAKKYLLINSTDYRKSNSAAMYLSLLSYVANNDNVVQNQQQADQILPTLKLAFQRQGFVQNSSAAPFEDYLVMGMGKAPMVMVYESQFVHQAISQTGSVTDDMVLIYPEPTIYSKHVLVGLTEAGQQAGELLETDPELQAISLQYGFRTKDVAGFRKLTKDQQLSLPNQLVNVIDPPSYEMTEYMIEAIANDKPQNSQ